MDNYAQLKSLSDRRLLNSLKTLVRKEAETLVDILLHLNEVRRRRLFAAQGYSSLFDYCTRGPLRYSNAAAHRRISAARCISRFPELIPLLQTKEITLCSLSAVAGILDEKSKDEVIAGIRGRSKRAVDELLAGWNTKKPRRERIKPVPPKQIEQTPPLFPKLEGEDQPEAAERFEVEFTIGKELMEKYEEVKSLLSRKYPKGVSMEQIFDELLEVYLEKHCPVRREKRRQKRLNRKPDSLPPVEVVKSGRYIPQAVKDMVWVRDGGRCTYVGPDGRRCNSRHNLQFDHIKAFAKGGDSSPGNMQLLCWQHNQYRAECEYGREFMGRFQDPLTTLAPGS